MSTHPELHDAILRFYERPDHEFVENTLLSDSEIEKHIIAVLSSYEQGSAPLGPQDVDFEGLAERWLKQVNDWMCGYAIATMVARGQVIVMIDPKDGEFTFLHVEDGRRIIEEHDAA